MNMESPPVELKLQTGASLPTSRSDVCFYSTFLVHLRQNFFFFFSTPFKRQNNDTSDVYLYLFFITHPPSQSGLRVLLV